MEVILNTEFKKWLSYSGDYVIGYAFMEGNLFRENELLTVIRKAINNQILTTVLNKLNGSFAAIIKYQDSYYLIVDKLRSYPILYVKKQDGWKILNDVNEILNDKNFLKEADEQSLKEFVATGYLSGSKTLLKEVSQVEAGTYVVLSDSNKNVVTYHSFSQVKEVFESDQKLFKTSDEILTRAFARMLESIGGRQIVIPLSGGYDSRLVACFCKKLNYENVICFSYGRSDSFEVEISRNVAKQLGFRWYFIEYTDSLLKAYIKSETFQDYFGTSHCFVSIPHGQDFYAVAELNKQGIINKDAVFVPGHSGDLLGGSKLPVKVFNDSFVPDIDSVTELIYDNFFDLNKSYYNRKENCCQLIRKQLGDVRVQTVDHALDVYETDWFIKSKIANFIVNSMRVYEWFGYDWRLPLWDDEYASLWYKVSWQYKLNSELYNRFMSETYFIPFHVNYQKKVISKRVPVVKRVIPVCLKSVLSRYVNKFNRRLNFNSQNIMVNLFKNLNGENHFYNINRVNDINSVVVIYFLNRFYLILNKRDL